MQQLPSRHSEGRGAAHVTMGSLGNLSHGGSWLPAELSVWSHPVTAWQWRPAPRGDCRGPSQSPQEQPPSYLCKKSITQASSAQGCQLKPPLKNGASPFRKGHLSIRWK